MNLETDIRRRLLSFYEPHEVEVWMNTRQPLFGKKTAKEMIDSGRGAEVDQALEQLESGAFI
jgi:hypothetical protein